MKIYLDEDVRDLGYSGVQMYSSPEVSISRGHSNSFCTKLGIHPSYPMILISFKKLGIELIGGKAQLQDFKALVGDKHHEEYAFSLLLKQIDREVFLKILDAQHAAGVFAGRQEVKQQFQQLLAS